MSGKNEKKPKPTTNKPKTTTNLNQNQFFLAEKDMRVYAFGDHALLWRVSLPVTESLFPLFIPHAP